MTGLVTADAWSGSWHRFGTDQAILIGLDLRARAIWINEWKLGSKKLGQWNCLRFDPLGKATYGNRVYLPTINFRKV
jgi:hypothetical protein